MKKRFYTAVVMGIIIIPLLIIEQISLGFSILLLVFSGIGAFELTRLFLKDHPGPRTRIPLTIISTMLVAALLGGIGRSSQPFSLRGQELVMGFMVVLVVWLVIYVFRKDFMIEQVSQSLFSILYVGLGSGAVILLRSWGLYFVIYLLITTFVTDIFAYFVGMSIGKHKMAPTISPKKSWEGAIGGTVIASIVGILFAMHVNWFMPIGSFLNPNGVTHLFNELLGVPQTIKNVVIIVMTPMLSIFAQLGDLVASKLKRERQVKDFGTIFPGHGGVLDRFDSTFFNAIILIIIFIFLVTI